MSQYEDRIRRVHEPFKRDHERLRTELMNRLAETATASESPDVPALPRRYWTGGTPMRRMAVRFSLVAAAAAVLAVVGWWPDGGKGSGIAWADVVRQVSVFRPYFCRYTWEYDGREPASHQEMRLSLARRREVRPDGSIFIVDLSQAPNRTLLLRPAQKLAVEETIPGTSPRQDPDLLRILAGMSSGDATDLGIKTVEGREAHGFFRPDPINEFTVWADTKTGLPIRIEVKQPRLARRLILSEFDLDTPLDESLFDTTAPAGYTVQPAP